jgi:hypothetical protein
MYSSTEVKKKKEKKRKLSEDGSARSLLFYCMGMKTTAGAE